MLRRYRPSFRAGLLGLAPLALCCCWLFGSSDELVVAGSELDGGGVADAPVDAAPKPFCRSVSPAPMFCADFDEVVGLTEYPGLNINTCSACTLTLGTDASVSPPRALVGTAPIQTTSEVGSARLYRAFSGADMLQGLTLSLQLRVDRIDSGRESIVWIEFENGYEVALFVGLSGGYLREAVPTDGGSVDYRNVSYDWRPTLGKWSEIRLDLAWSTPSSTSNASLAFDGTTVLDKTPLAINQYRTPKFGLTFGVNYVGSNDAPCVFLFDNVLLTGKN